MGILLIVLISFFLLPPPAHPQQNVPDQPGGVTIHTEPLDAFEAGNPARTRFGALEFLGGLVLTSSNRLFGGISALRVQEDGARFIALTDTGTWLRGRIEYNGNRPTGIADASVLPILDAGGKPAYKWDTESLAEDEGGILYVGIEYTNRIVSFNYGKNDISARAEPFAVPAGVKDLPKSKGLEAMVFVPKKYPLGGTLIAISESGLKDEGDIAAFLIGGPSPGSFAVKRSQDYSISDAALLPNGDLLILERKLSLLNGFCVRIRRIRLAEIKQDAVVDGPVIFEADMRCQIDNMEALGIHRTNSGETVLTLMSDNNFFPVQRTLLLQFALREK